MSEGRLITDREGMWNALKEFLRMEDITTGVRIITGDNDFVVIYENGSMQDQLTVIKAVIRVIVNENEITFHSWDLHMTVIKRNGRVEMLRVQDRVQGQNRNILKEIRRIEELASEGKPRLRVYNRIVQPRPVLQQPHPVLQQPLGRLIQPPVRGRLVQPTFTLNRETMEREEMNIIRRRLGEERWVIDPQTRRYVRGYIIPTQNVNDRPVLAPPRAQYLPRNPPFVRPVRIVQPSRGTTRPVQITRNGQVIPNRMVKERIDVDEDDSETVEAKPMEIIDLSEESEEEKKEEDKGEKDLKQVKVQNEDDSATEELENPSGDSIKMK